MTNTLLHHYVEMLHLNPKSPFPSQVAQGKKGVLERRASYPSGCGAVILLFKRPLNT